MQKTLANQVLAECDGDYRKAIDELRHRLDREDSHHNQEILTALEALRLSKRKQSR